MTNYLLGAIAGLIGLVLGFVAASLWRKDDIERKRREAEESARQMLEQARKEAEALRREANLEAKDRIIEARAEMEQELKERRRELAQMEKRLLQKEENLERKTGQIEKTQQDLNRREREIRREEAAVAGKMAEAEGLLARQQSELERISGMTAEAAKRELFERVEKESRFEAARIAKRIEEEAAEEAKKKSQKIISLAIERYASDYVADATVSAVALPSDEMKGRIIGREGRNIRALEAATGVDLIIDDTPESVVISGFDPVRRQVAKTALEKLISDGRIHPARIEEVVEKARREVEAVMKEEGERAVFDLGIHGVHPEIVKLLGRLKFRTSYAQNALEHSREVAYFAGMMAAELGVNAKLAKRAGLLHDIGKAVDHEVEGTHAAIGADLARRHGEDPRVVNAIASHHDDVEALCAESVLVAAADALSAARPGARKESLDAYLKRLSKIEEIANSFDGVEKSYAIQAGREIRIIVENEQITDEKAAVLAKEICRKIEQELTYPGKIKVTVIRESRFVEYAK